MIPVYTSQFVFSSVCLFCSQMFLLLICLLELPGLLQAKNSPCCYCCSSTQATQHPHEERKPHALLSFPEMTSRSEIHMTKKQEEKNKSCLPALLLLRLLTVQSGETAERHVSVLVSLCLLRICQGQ